MWKRRYGFGWRVRRWHCRGCVATHTTFFCLLVRIPSSYGLRRSQMVEFRLAVISQDFPGLVITRIASRAVRERCQGNIDEAAAVSMPLWVRPSLRAPTICGFADGYLIFIDVSDDDMGYWGFREFLPGGTPIICRRICPFADGLLG